MKVSSINTVVLALAMSLGMSGYVHAQSSQILNPPIKAEGKKKAKKARGSKAKVMADSGETRKERDSRLKRECKGQVNAGACAGYTR